LLHVYAIDDDSEIREYIKTVLESVNISVSEYPSVEEFLEHLTPDTKGCILSDIVMPKTTGLALLEILTSKEIDIPVIFMSSYADVQMARQIFKGGAADFLPKPVSATELIEVVTQVLDKERNSLPRQGVDSSLYAEINKLTGREKHILELLTQGKNNKEIAKELSISIRTVETHRSKVLKKMQMPSLQKLLSKLNPSFGLSRF